MKVVFDTNVLVSAVLRDRNPETVILFVARRNDFEWIVSSEILAEYTDVLNRARFGLPDEIKLRWFNLLDSLTTLIDVKIAIYFPRDQKDAKFLACALTANADFFVTGDSDFSQAQQLVNTRILSVTLFKQLVCEPLS